jgi:DNA-binding FrmR family transcriptional regulator
MSHITENKKKLSARISRIKGQVDAIEKSLHAGVECTHFLHQVASVRGAIDGLMSEALEGHIREHLGHHLSRHDDEHDESSHQHDLEEVINVLKTYLK